MTQACSQHQPAISSDKTAHASASRLSGNPVVAEVVKTFGRLFLRLPKLLTSFATVSGQAPGRLSGNSLAAKVVKTFGSVFFGLPKLLTSVATVSGQAPRCPGRCLLIACGMVVLLNSSAFAQLDASDVSSEIQNLQSQLDQLKAAYGIETLPESSSVSPPHAWNSGPVYQSCPPASAAEKPKYPTSRLTGFFQSDASMFDQDAGNRAAIGNIQDGADFRRARLAAVGKAWDNVSYMLEMDFAFIGRPTFMDVWLQLEDVGGGNIRIGQFRHPFGMDGQTSVKELPFLERGLPFAFLPFRQIGAMYQTHNEDESTTWALSGFRFPTDVFGGNVGDSGGFGLATRLTTLLVDNGDDGVVHLGGGYCFGDPSHNFVRYANQPEVFVAETGGAGLATAGVLSNVPPFVDTGLIPTQNFNLMNAELGASGGSFHAQSEVFFAMVNQIRGSSLNFSGAYAHAGYFLTGETRPYNRKAGVFGRVVPNKPFGQSGWGAWEVAGRWSYLDLNNKNIQGGRLNDLTFGLNWYLNRNTKFQLNYIHAMLASSSAAALPARPVVSDSHANIVALRAQVDF